MATYDAIQALQSIDRNFLSIAIVSSIAGELAFVYFWESIRLGFWHKTFSAPLAATICILPHHLSFVLSYDKWFNVYQHWWCMAWWSVLTVWLVVLALQLYQAIEYGREELLPHSSQKFFSWAVIGVAIGAGAVWWVVKASLDDDLFFTSLLLTIVWPIPFTTAQLLRRKSRKGISVLQQAVLIPLYLALWGTLCIIDPLFRSVDFIVLTAITLAWATINVYLTVRAKPYGEEEAGESAWSGPHPETALAPQEMQPLAVVELR